MQHDQAFSCRRFGVYLRQLRQAQGLTISEVERITASSGRAIRRAKLSLIELGDESADFDEVCKLSAIYRVPLATLGQQLEFEVRREGLPIDLSNSDVGELAEHVRGLRLLGREAEAMVILEVMLERKPSRRQRIRIQLERVDCLIHMGRYRGAREEIEALLASAELEPFQRLTGLLYYATICFRLERFHLALMIYQRVETELPSESEYDALRAYLCGSRANALGALGRFDQAIQEHQAAQDRYASLGIDLEVGRCMVNRAAVLIESGRMDSARRLLIRAVGASGDLQDRQAAFALSHLAKLAYLDGEFDACRHYAEDSNALALPREHHKLAFRNSYYLWRMAQETGDRQTERRHERRLRSSLGRLEERIPEVELYRTRCGDRA